MIKIALVAVAFVAIIGCQVTKQNSDTNNEGNVSKTYAEISVKDGGYWKGREYMEGNFKNVTSLNVPPEHTDHSWFIRYEGPGWENSQIGYRIYLDWRNAIDIFGKRADTLVLPYVGQDGFDSYHEAADWGQDILKAGKSMGIGGYGREVGGVVEHFRNVKHTTANIQNSKNNSTVNITYENWKTSTDSIDLRTQLTIYPKDRFTKAELKPSKQITGICTGIVKIKNIPLQKKAGQKWAYIATYGNQTLVSGTDKLGMAVFYRLDEVAEQKTGIDDHLIVFKPSDKALTYYFLGAWEQEANGITNETDFISDLNKKLVALENSNTL